MEGRLFLNVVVRQGATILQLLSSKNQSLLIRGDTFLVLNLGLDIVNGVRGFNIKGDGLACNIKREKHKGQQHSKRVTQRTEGVRMDRHDQIRHGRQPGIIENVIDPFI